jgi:hypothetical protein
MCQDKRVNYEVWKINKLINKRKQRVTSTYIEGIHSKNYCPLELLSVLDNSTVRVNAS